MSERNPGGHASQEGLITELSDAQRVFFRLATLSGIRGGDISGLLLRGRFPTNKDELKTLPHGMIIHAPLVTDDGKPRLVILDESQSNIATQRVVLGATWTGETPQITDHKIQRLYDRFPELPEDIILFAADRLVAMYIKLFSPSSESDTRRNQSGQLILPQDFTIGKPN